MLCVEYENWICYVKVSKLRKSFFRHFCKSEKLKLKSSLIWNFEETIENQKTEKLHTFRHLFCFLIKNLKKNKNYYKQNRVIFWCDKNLVYFELWTWITNQQAAMINSTKKSNDDVYSKVDTLKSDAN